MLKENCILTGQNVTILGWARSGIAAARLCEKLGAKVFVSEAKPEEALDEKSRIELNHYEHESGNNTKKALSADLIVLSPGIPLSIPILKNYTGRIWSELELAWRSLPCRTVAITGTNGKTTTTTLLGNILSQCYKNGKTYVGGNIGTAASEAALSARPEDLCVLEISSFQLETIEKFRPDIAVFLNLRSDHLDRYSNINEYAEANRRIFMNMQKEDIAVLNIDDEYTAGLADELRNIKVVKVSAQKKADYNLRREFNSQILEAVKAPENLLSAVAVADILGVDFDEMMEVLRKFKGLPHRIEKIGSIGDVVFYDDSKATNVHSVEAALLRLDSPIVLVMGGKDKGEDYSEILDLVRKKCRCVVSYGNAAERIQKILGGEIVFKFDSAVKRAYELAKPDASVILSPACSSYDQFKDYVERGERFKKAFSELQMEKDL